MLEFVIRVRLDMMRVGREGFCLLKIVQASPWSQRVLLKVQPKFHSKRLTLAVALFDLVGQFEKKGQRGHARETLNTEIFSLAEKVTRL